MTNVEEVNSISIARSCMEKEIAGDLVAINYHARLERYEYLVCTPSITDTMKVVTVTFEESNKPKVEAVTAIFQKVISSLSEVSLKLVLTGELVTEVIKDQLESDLSTQVILNPQTELNSAAAFKYLMKLEENGLQSFECKADRLGRYDNFSSPFVEFMISLMENTHSKNDVLRNNNAEGDREKRSIMVGVISDRFDVIKISPNGDSELIHSNSSLSQTGKHGFARLMCKIKSDSEFLDLAHRGDASNVSNTFKDIFPPNYPFSGSEPMDMLTNIFAKDWEADTATLQAYKREDLADAALRFFFVGPLLVLNTFALQLGARDIYVFDEENKMNDFMLHYIDNRMFIREFAGIAFHFMKFEHLDLLGAVLNA